MIRTNRLRILELLQDSELTTEQRQEVLGFLQLTGDEHLEPLVELFENDPSEIPKFYENVSKKHEAVVAKDMNALQKILEQEREEIVGSTSDEK